MSESTTDFSLPTPGDQHQLLQPFVGTFRAEVKMWMGPGDPHVTTGQMVNTLELNGLFLQQDYQGDEVEGPFPSFRGKGFWGYNSMKKVFEGFWIDIASDQMQTESGGVDESGKVWEMRGKFDCPGAGTMDKRSVITLVDENHHRMETFHTMAGQAEAKTMEINYVRV